VKKIDLLLMVIGALSLLFAQAAWGQSNNDRLAGEDWGQYYRIFDPKSVETYRGEVVTMDRLAPGGGMSNRVWLGLKTDKGMILVILGPTWYHQKMNITIEPKDMVEVKGSMITSMEEPIVIAITVKKGDQVIKLRDDSGYPLWAPPKPLNGSK
jgi:hypothetical protein